MKQPTSDNAKLPESMKQACCNICTLADVMKDCKKCAFYKVANTIKVNDLVRFVKPNPDEIGLWMKVLEVNGDRLLIEYQVKNLDFLPNAVILLSDVTKQA